MGDLHGYSARGESVLDLQHDDSAFQSQLSSGHDLEATPARDAEPVIKAAMEDTLQHPAGHRLAVLPSRAYSSVAVMDVAKLTTSDQQLVLSRAMETEGQDNERLLTKIRERQDRCAQGRAVAAIDTDCCYVVGACARPSHADLIFGHQSKGCASWSHVVQQLSARPPEIKIMHGLQCRSGAV